MIRRNIDVTLGLVNGTIGKVISVSRSIENSNKIDKIIIELPTGSECVIVPVSVKFEIMDKIYVVRKQFPICLSYGITIHKSQGLSLKNAIIDAGNSVFSSGQVYVALSRLTSLEGLHLINFDPQSVKASDSAIIEYSRLRKNHDPPLSGYDIVKNTHRRIKDNMWIVPKIVIDGQDEMGNGDNEKIKIHGIPNTDQTSSYANATLQCILNITHIREVLLTSTIPTEIRDFIENYMNKHTKLNTFQMRNVIGNKFTMKIQYDPLEFLRCLFIAMPKVKAIVIYELDTKINCKKCSYNETINESNDILNLSAEELYQNKKSFPLQELIDGEITTKWRTLPNRVCNQCSAILLYRKKINTSKILILRLMLFVSGKNNVIVKRNCRISAATQTIVIDRIKYNVISAILHCGNHPEHGTYTSIIHDVKSSWIYVNNETVVKSRWPRNSKNVYILFLQKRE